MRSVIIVGGGIAGLSTAWYLQQRAAAAGLPLHCTVLERSNRWGGKVQSEHIDGYGGTPFVVEAGPDSFLTQKPWALQLTRELGLGDRLLNTNEHQRRVFVLHKGRSIPLPDGVMMIVPTQFRPFAFSPLLSLVAKLRMGMDLFIPAKRDGEDETVADFVSRRLGAEALDKLAEPLMSGIYNAEADRQSLLATFPRFRELEVKHGSLIRGMLASKRARAAAPAPAPGAGKPPAAFVSLQGGTQELIDGLLAKLRVELRLNADVTALDPQAHGCRLTLHDGSQIEADAVVLANPAYLAAELLAAAAPAAAAKLEAIRYVGTGTLSLAFRRSEVKHPLNGFGLVIPRSEGRPINAVTWTSTKFAGRAPEGYILLRVFFGGSRRPEMMAKGDEELLRIAAGELRELMGIDTAPVLHRIYRWPRANPQYDVGHLDHVTAIESELPPGVFVTGSPYRGIGLPDCVHQGDQTAAKVLGYRKP